MLLGIHWPLLDPQFFSGLMKSFSSSFRMQATFACSVCLFSKIISVPAYCCKKILRSRYFISSVNWFLTEMEAGDFNIKVLVQHQVSGKDPVSASKMMFWIHLPLKEMNSLSSHGRKWEAKNSWLISCSFYKALILAMSLATRLWYCGLVTYQWLHFLIILLWGLSFNMNFGEDTAFQAITKVW